MKKVYRCYGDMGTFGPTLQVHKKEKKQRKETKRKTKVITLR